MSIRVAINGFGRIGRCVLRAAWDDPEIEFVHINDLTSDESLAYLLGTDSVHGRFGQDVEAVDGGIRIGDRVVATSAIRDPADLPWRAKDVDVVLECTGANASVNQCIDLAKKLGRYTQIGLFGKPVQIDMDRLVTKQLRLQGSICHTWGTWDRTLSFLGQGLIDLRPLISAKLPLGRWEEGFRKVINREGAKILLYPEE